MPERKFIIPRRTFVSWAAKIALATGVAVSTYYGVKELSQPTEIEQVKSGETGRLPYFTYTNQLPGYTVSFSPRVMRTWARKLGFRLQTPDTMEIVMLPDVNLSQPFLIDYAFSTAQETEAGTRVEIAGGFVVEIAEYIIGGRAQDVRGEAYLSVAHNLAMVSGMLQAAALKGEMTIEDARANTELFRLDVTDEDAAELPTWMHIAGNAPPDWFTG